MLLEGLNRAGPNPSRKAVKGALEGFKSLDLSGILDAMHRLTTKAGLSMSCPCSEKAAPSFVDVIRCQKVAIRSSVHGRAAQPGEIEQLRLHRLRLGRRGHKWGTCRKIHLLPDSEDKEVIRPAAASGCALNTKFRDGRSCWARTSDQRIRVCAGFPAPWTISSPSTRIASFARVPGARGMLIGLAPHILVSAPSCLPVFRPAFSKLGSGLPGQK